MNYLLTTLFQKYNKSQLFFITCFLGVLNFTCFSQEINCKQLKLTSENLKESLNDNDNYFSGGNNDLPYFQGKTNDLYIKFYKSTGTIVIFDFKSKTEYLKIIREIQSNLNFRFKYCTDYNEPIIYNYQTNSGNKIRFNFNEMRISVEYPSKVNSFLNSNSEFTSVFVCVSKEAYAYHTNLRCEGLANCDAKIAKSNIKEAKEYNFRICEICSTDE